MTHHGDNRTHGMDEPLPTITGANRGELGLALPAAELADEILIDINYRMLHWRELARATSFDDEGEVYDFAGNATEITKQIGPVLREPAALPQPRRPRRAVPRPGRLRHQRAEPARGT